ncbi:MAG: GAF domain-containing protein [Proteobacteria bacterium]|nr:MAG: GAF domain-containing protein [Pseudomonadota bacterium]
MKELNRLDDCSQEPIHIPGAIQPHGYLFVINEKTLAIERISENLTDFFQLDAREIVGKTVTDFLSESCQSIFLNALTLNDLRQANPIPIAAQSAEATLGDFNGILHRSSGQLIMEWEPIGERARAGEALSFLSFFHQVRAATLAVQESSTFEQLCQTATEEVKRISGFDRVLIYKFEEDWTGVTLAESREAHMDAYLGLRFPASDIPEQARRLYTTNWLRLIANCDYRPAAIIPQSPTQLDMSQSTLRSVSPVHLQYMKNMKTAASMSISIIKDGELWGLISCHHAEPRYVDYQTRVALEFVGQTLSQQIQSLEGRDDYRQRQTLRAIEDELYESIAEHGLTPALEARTLPFLELTRASALVIKTGESILNFGKAPDRVALDKIISTLKEQTFDRYYATNELGRLIPDLDESMPAGLLAVPLSEGRDSFFLWFRPEIIRTVSWAGRPEKIPANVEGGGGGGGKEGRKLHPRLSFDSWQEIKRGLAEPWLRAEIDAAIDLRNRILSKELARTNEELAESNAELDGFASIVAHDLKEPLRGIRQYSQFIVEDDAPKLSRGSQDKLSSIADLSLRMDALLNGLYQYSRVGRVKLAMTETDLNQVLSEVLVRIRPILDEKKGHIILPQRLPTLTCDSIRSGEVFYNLILNALKYNKNVEKFVEIGVEEGPEPVFYVKDNGIGIAKEQLDSIFRIFKRLHQKEDFGGGTGSGLAIAKRIVQRHSGKIWAESNGEGSTFRFTFGPQI